MQNKNIIRFCFIGIFFIVIANIILYRQLIVEKVILEKVSTNNQLLVDTYLNYVSSFCKNISQSTKKSPDMNLSSSCEDEMEAYSKSFFKNLDILKVVISDEGGKVIFQSNELDIVPISKSNVRASKEMAPLFDYLIFKDPIDKEKLMLNAIVKTDKLNYNNANVVVDEMEIKGIDDSIYKIKFYSDISEIWQEMSLIEVKIFFAITGFFLALFIVIVHNTRFAQKIIDEKNKVNRTLEEQKMKAEKESTYKSQFLANVSHELRTPLNSIIGFSEIILASKDDAKKAKASLEYINDIYNSGKHLLAVINDILDYSKIIAEELPIDIIEMNINKSAAYSMRLIEPRADKSNIKLIQDFPKKSPVIKADSKRLRQALLNVLTNAVKFTPKGGSVTLKIEERGKKVHIRVIDTGIGIAAENIPKALSSFQQIDDKKDRHYEGTGLGLPLTKKLVELMNGKFEIESKEGKGTTITFTFKST